jgi:hypothetical protein
LKKDAWKRFLGIDKGMALGPGISFIDAITRHDAMKFTACRGSREIDFSRNAIKITL